MRQNIIDKYNIPVPRYTSYPPANYFGTLGQTEYIEAVKLSNTDENRNLSFYFHMPFCRHLCHYCACNSYAMGNSAKVNEYIDALHKEIDLLLPYIDKDRRISQIHYGGGTPTAMPAQILKELNQHILSHFGTIDKPEIAIECHPGYLTLNDWSSLVDAGFTRFSIGVQDFDEKVLKAVNRRPTLEPIEEIFALLREAEANINLDFLYGLPYQTVESFSSTIERAIALQPDRLVTFSYAHVPWLKKQQLILEKYGLPSVQTKETMFETSAQLLQKAGYVRVGMDHFVRPHDELYTALCQHRLHRNFQGYSTQPDCDLVGLGVSAISKVGAVYSQNAKTLEEYQAPLEAGHLPVVRGLTASADDLLRRAVIMAIMCQGRVRFADIEAAHGINFASHFAAELERLRAMQGDGLVQVLPDAIQVTDMGWFFVRGVAMVFDTYVQSARARFSKIL